MEQVNKVLAYLNPIHNGMVHVVFEDASAVRNAVVSGMMGRIVKRWKAVERNRHVPQAAWGLTGLTPVVYHVNDIEYKNGAANKR